MVVAALTLVEAVEDDIFSAGVTMRHPTMRAWDEVIHPRSNGLFTTRVLVRASRVVNDLAYHLHWNYASPFSDHSGLGLGSCMYIDEMYGARSPAREATGMTAE
jgi:hypothetical protein